MANLIITIISLAIFAIVAAAAIYYGGQAYQSAQLNATFNAWTSQNTQILQAAQLFTQTYGGDVVPMCGLYNGKYLETWPNFLNGAPSPYGFPPNQGSLMTTMGFEGGCWSGNGNSAELGRATLGYNGSLIELTQFTPTSGFVGYCSPPLSVQWNSSSTSNSFPVQLATLFNQSSFSNLPTGLPTYYTGGPPKPSPSWTAVSADSPIGCSGNPPKPNLTSQSGYNIYVDSTGKIMTGCIIVNTSHLECFQMQ